VAFNLDDEWDKKYGFGKYAKGASNKEDEPFTEDEEWDLRYGFRTKDDILAERKKAREEAAYQTAVETGPPEEAPSYLDTLGSAFGAGMDTAEAGYNRALGELARGNLPRPATPFSSYVKDAPRRAHARADELATSAKGEQARIDRYNKDLGPVSHFFAETGQDIAGSASSFLPLAAIPFGPLAVGGAAAIPAMQAFGSSVEEGYQAGLPPEEYLPRGAVQAGGEYIFEGLPGTKLFKWGATVPKRVLGRMTGEGVGEYLTPAAQRAADLVMSDDSEAYNKLTSQPLAEEMWRGGKAGFFGAGPITVPGSFAEVRAERAAKAKDAAKGKPTPTINSGDMDFDLGAEVTKEAEKAAGFPSVAASQGALDFGDMGDLFHNTQGAKELDAEVAETRRGEAANSLGVPLGESIPGGRSEERQSQLEREYLAGKVARDSANLRVVTENLAYEQAERLQRQAELESNPLAALDLRNPAGPKPRMRVPTPAPVQMEPTQQEMELPPGAPQAYDAPQQEMFGEVGPQPQPPTNRNQLFDGGPKLRVKVPAPPLPEPGVASTQQTTTLPPQQPPVPKAAKAPKKSKAQEAADNKAAVMAGITVKPDGNIELEANNGKLTRTRQAEAYTPEQREAAKRIFYGAKNGTDLLKRLAPRIKNPELKAVADRLLETNNFDDLEVRFVDEGENDSVRVMDGRAAIPMGRALGKYGQNGNKRVVMFKGITHRAHGLTPETMLHELVHAATVRKIDAARDKNAVVSKATREAVQELEKLRSIVATSRGIRPTHKQAMDSATGDLKEFVTYAMTNPEFREDLRKIGAGKENQTLWDRLVATIAKLVGLKGKENLLDRILVSADALVAETDPVANGSVTLEATDGTGNRILTKGGSKYLFLRNSDGSYKVNEYITIQGQETRRSKQMSEEKAIAEMNDLVENGFTDTLDATDGVDPKAKDITFSERARTFEKRNPEGIRGRVAQLPSELSGGRKVIAKTLAGVGVKPETAAKAANVMSGYTEILLKPIGAASPRLKAWIERSRGEATEQITAAMSSINAIQNRMRVLAKNLSEAEGAKFRQTIRDGLTGHPEKVADPLIRENLKVLRAQIDSLTKQIIYEYASGVEGLSNKEVAVLQAMKKNMGTYLTQTYQAFQKTKQATKFKEERIADFKLGRDTDAAEFTRRAIEYLKANELVIPDDLENMDPHAFRRLYAHWTGHKYGKGRLRLKKGKGDFTDKAKLAMDKLRKIKEENKDLDERALQIAEELLNIRNSGGGVISYYRGGQLDRKLLIPRKKVPRSIQEFLGIIDDPIYKAIDTIAKQAQLASSIRLLNKVKETGLAEGWVSETPTDLTSEEMKGPSSGPLKGLYVTPRVKGILGPLVTASMGTGKWAEFLNKNEGLKTIVAFAGYVFAAFSKIPGWTKAAEIIGNFPGAYLFNILGSILTTFQSGVFMNPKAWVSGGKAAIGIVNMLNGTTPRSKETLAVIRNDLIDSGQMGEIQHNELEKLISLIDNEFLDSQFKTLPKKVWHFFTNFYAITDLWPKLAVFFHEQKMLTSFYERQGVEKSERDIEIEAAERAKRVGVTFNRAFPIIRTFTERSGLTMFGTYFAEVFRSSTNAAIQGIVDVNKGIELKDGKLIQHGAEKLIGQSIAISIPFIANSLLYGDDESEEEKRMIQNSMPDGFRNSILYEVERKPNGDIVYADASRLDPADPRSSLFRSLVAGDARGIAKATAGLVFTNTAWTAMKHSYEAVATDKDIPDPSKVKGWDEADQAWREGLRSVGFYDRDIANNIMEWADVFTPTAVFNLVSGFDGDDGPAQNTMDFMGLKPVVYSPRGNLQREGAAKYTVGVNGARSELAERLADRPNLSEEQIEVEYLRYVSDEQDAFTRLQEVYAGAMAAGLGTSEARKILKESNIGEEALSALRTGEFKPRSFGEEFGETVTKSLKEKAIKRGESGRDPERLGRDVVRSLNRLRRDKYYDLLYGTTED
jgi:hypothetical protein